MILSILLIALLSFALTFREKMIFDYPLTGLPAGHSFFDPGVSWKNKWKNGDPSSGPRFLLSTSLFVWMTDFYHLLMMVANLCLLGFMLTYEPSSHLGDSIILFLLAGSVRGLTLSLPNHVKGVKSLITQAPSAVMGWQGITVLCFALIIVVDQTLGQTILSDSNMTWFAISVFAAYMLLLLSYVKKH